MKLIQNIFFFSLLLLFSCNKKDKDPETVSTPIADNPTDTGLKCQNLPKAPVPFGWQDTLNDEEKNVNALVYSPLNPDELIYMVNGTIFGGYNKLYNYHIPTQKSVQLGFNLNHLPQVNKLGWVLYSDVNFDIWMVKINGDSLTKFTNNQISDDPKWDYTGKYLYYFQRAKDNLPTQIVKVGIDGNFVTAFAADLPNAAPFKNSNKLIYLKIKNNTNVSLILKDVVNAIETTLLTGPLESAPGQPYFDNLCLDNNDENFFWSNSKGIFTCNLSTLKIDTLFKNCENIIFTNPIYSFKANEMYYSQHNKIPITAYKLLHQYKPIEYNLLSKQGSEVKVFP